MEKYCMINYSSKNIFNKSIYMIIVFLSILSYYNVKGNLKRCVSCRSRGELGSCRDPFTINSTLGVHEPGIKIEPCASGWCGKIIESLNEYATATQRMCFQRPPDDGEERCSFTIKNWKKVFMCFCKGDLCNDATSVSVSRYLISMSIVLILVSRII
ncbi:uncharacterized protein LOC122859309 [Aphidius gifuensis]|uniref:uncharacterized protein LOC122859309 n=1 Tax=Aphidius gifuensis TaxID=684658 RepID=UPI001CDBA070|nr:uncharacterized protein LOC122859309 [Aphidius gifuensis]